MWREVYLFKGQEVAGQLRSTRVSPGRIVGVWVRSSASASAAVGVGVVVGGRIAGMRCSRVCRCVRGRGRAAEVFEEIGEAGRVHVEVGCGGVARLEGWEVIGSV